MFSSKDISSRREMSQFDRRRLINLQIYNKLQTNKDRMNFIWTVKDYMAYLRTDPRRETNWQEREEAEVIQAFVRAVRSKAGWPLARQVVPEFQKPRADLQALPQPLRTVMKGVQDLQTQVKIEAPNSQREEERAHWEAWKVQLEYIAYLKGLVQNASPQDQDEVKKSIQPISEAIDLVSCPSFD